MSPAKAQLALQQALQQHNAGKLAQAAAGYAQIRAALPNHFDAHHLGGAAALQLNKLTEAVTLLRRALQLRPKAPATAMCLGVAYGQLGQFEEADKALRVSVAQDANSFEAWSNLAALLVSRGKLEEAAEAYSKCLKLKPNFAHGWTALGCVLQFLGRCEEAVEHHSRALQLDPKNPKARSSRAQALQGLHRTEDALADFDEHCRRQPDDLEAASLRLMLLHYFDSISREQLAEEHRRYGQRVSSVALQNKSKLPSSVLHAIDEHKRLRVGFLSPDLRTHSVAYFLEAILENLAQENVDVFLYHDHYCVDETSRRLAALGSAWRHLVGQSSETVETTIRADQLDVLVDLTGHTGNNRLPLFARRLAPTQVNYLGYPNTTGIMEMDFRLTDPIADPAEPAVEALHTETLMRFPRCAWTYRPSCTTPDVVPLPAIQRDVFTFASFNSLSKINAYTLRLWNEVLAALPESRLLLKSLGLKKDLVEKRLAAAGMDLARVTILPASNSTIEHLACYAEADVALDPFPYHGTTTTCEALWMGLPVISLVGDRHSSRVGASLLQAIGHPEWSAPNAQAYVATAVKLASDRNALAQTRAGLRDEFRASALFGGTDSAAANFGAMIRSCWLQKHRRSGFSAA
ncbi:MAG TPA: tetratricopeptide repeat protein [Opitutaceae bacterium]|nr:tetratricopeptide repeat protein [Opitutaceae bacterium]